MSDGFKDDLRLIEAGFPCHQVGAETQRERGASSALPPLYYLHVWWARRPLTPSRAAILASLLPANTDPDWFLRQLGIKKRVVEINGSQWTLTGPILQKIEKNSEGREYIEVDASVLRLLEKENGRRAENCRIIEQLKSRDPSLANDPVLVRWGNESLLITDLRLRNGTRLKVTTIVADPAHVNERIAFAKTASVKKALGKEIKWDPEDLYGYSRAFMNPPEPEAKPMVVLDPTAGGGSIPFEALRLGHQVIANELNPVASVILHATLEYPAKYGIALAKDIKKWGDILIGHVGEKMADITPFSRLPEQEKQHLREHCRKSPEVIPQFDIPEYDQTGILYCRLVVCPNCGGEAPLLNTCWLSKEAGKKWGVRIVTDKRPRNGKVRFETYRLSGSTGPNGEDPEFATVKRGIGQCVHCRQAIDAEEIKKQARGESSVGKWQDRLYCVVAVRFQPKLDKHGKPQRYASGERRGEIKTEKVRFFRPPNERDLAGLIESEKRLKENWDRWDAAGLIPTEEIPIKSNYNRGHRMYGVYRWNEMFLPRQLIGHLLLMEELNRLKPDILGDLGVDKGTAVVAYLQCAIDKGLDYNSNQTRWEYTRGIIKGTFSRHNFAVQWIFGEMIFSGPNSGSQWALDQVLDAYKGLAVLQNVNGNSAHLRRPLILNRTAAHLPEIKKDSVDLICIDPPYYDNVLYAELSDFFYVWQKRTLSDLFPEYFNRILTNKNDEAVANRARDGSSSEAKASYEKLMGEIFLECQRVLKADGLMTLMFNHKTQEAWETLTRSLIENGWMITASIPVESESEHGTHHMGKAAAVSSIFISCRKRDGKLSDPSTWTGFGGSGVQQKIRKAVQEGLEEFKPLKLNPVDEMVASYGRALRVLSEDWPVLDGDEPVSPIRAMNEASRGVAENQVHRITEGRLRVGELSPETAMALTLFGIYGLGEFSYDEALNLSRSLNISLESKPAGYTAEGSFIGINTEAGSGRRSRASTAEDTGFHAPLLRKGSKLRLARPEERNEKRMENPQTEWDVLHGIIMAYREGDIPVARGYLNRHNEGNGETIKDLLKVWAQQLSDESLRKEAQAILFSFKN
jgi:adenine-specific DNA methylase